MPVTEMIVGISGGLFVLIGFVFLVRLGQAWFLHRTLREAIGRDSPIAADLVEKIDKVAMRGPPTQSDDRSGLVLIALGVAMAGFSIIADEASWARFGVGAALFPFLVGVVLLGRHLWLRRASRRGLDAGA